MITQECKVNRKIYILRMIYSILVEIVMIKQETYQEMPDSNFRDYTEYPDLNEALFVLYPWKDEVEKVCSNEKVDSTENLSEAQKRLLTMKEQAENEVLDVFDAVTHRKIHFMKVKL